MVTCIKIILTAILKLAYVWVLSTAAI
jgi:hypothetical protein